MKALPLGTVAALLTWAVAIAAAWLAVAGQEWAQTVLIAAVGALYLVFPPPARFPRFFPLLLVLLLILASTAFWPAAWFGSSFRAQFLNHGIVLPWTFSPQPWLTLEDLTLLIASLCWAWYCFENRLSLSQRDFLTGNYLLIMGVLAASFIVSGTVLGQQVPAFLQEAGRFANRNQTGDILVMGGILALFRGFTILPRRKVEGILWLLLAVVFVTAIFRNGSRAAVGLFVLGGLTGLLLMPRERRQNKLVAIALGSVVAVGIAIFVAEGEDLRRRFMTLLGGDDYRWGIYEDAFHMILTGPWNGVGLANFEGVFNVERTQTGMTMLRAIHPESDWLWVGVELGPGGILLFAIGVFLAFRLYLRKTPFPLLTKASIIVAVVFLVHTLIDVGGHRMGTVWNCLYLVGLGAFRNASRRDFKVPKFTMRLVGVALLAVAGLRVQSMGAHPWMPTRASLEKIQKDFLASDDGAVKVKLLDQSLAWSPFDWMVYYQRGLILMNSGDLSIGGDPDFDRALYVEQNAIDLPFVIGEVCRNTDRPEALVAWQEALRRGKTRREELFVDRFVGLSFSELMILANHDPNLEAIAVCRQGGADFDSARKRFLQEDPYLEGLSSAAARKLFARWLETGDNDALIAEWPIHPEWREAGWRAYDGALAKAERYDDAVNGAFRELAPPPMPASASAGDLDAAQQAHLLQPQDPAVTYQLYTAQVAAGQADNAAATLKDMAALPNPPDYVIYLEAQNLMASGQSQAAWQALAPLLREPAAAPAPAPAIIPATDGPR